MKQLFRTLTLVVLPLLIAACNTDYNFDNVSLEVTVGDAEGISVPIGTTGKVTLESLLKEAGLETNEDGYYGFNYEDDMEYPVKLGTIPSITGLVPEIGVLNDELFGALSVDNMPTFEGDQYTKSLDFPAGISGNLQVTDAFLALVPDKAFKMHYDPHTFEASIDVELPKEVKSINTITFGENGEGSVLDLQFDLGGLAAVCESCTIEKFNIILPAGFTLAEKENDPLANYITTYNTSDSATPNVFHVENYTLTGSHLIVDVVVKSVDLSHLTIGESNKISISENVTFDLDFSGTLKTGTVSATSPYVSIKADGMSIHTASIKANEIEHPISFSENINESIDVPAEITDIEYLEISKVGDSQASPEFAVEVALKGAPLNSLELRDVEVSLPAFLDIEAPQGWAYADGKLTTSLIKVYNDENNEIVKLKINGIKELPIAEGKIDLNSTIGLSAKAAVAEGSEITINTSAQNISLTPVVRLDDIAIERVSGHIEPDLSALLEPQEIEIGDFTEALGNANLDLKIAPPTMNLVVTNPIGVGINAGLTLKAYKGTEVVSELTTPTLSILPAEDTTPKTTTIVINGEAPESGDYQLVQLDGLADMIAALPEKIEVVLDAKMSEGTHNLILQEEYNFAIAYAVEAAFKFDTEENGTIDYTVLVEDVDLSSLADIDIVVESLVLNVASESTLPIDLTMGVEFLDENSEPIECITSSTKGKIEGSTSAEAKLSNCAITINMAAPEEGVSPFTELARTKSVRCQLTGTTLAGGGLKPEQYITAKLSLLLDKGITVDLGSLLPEEKEPAGEEEPAE